MTAIQKAIDSLDTPTQAELARLLNVFPQEVNRWLRRGWAAPRHAPAIEKLTGVTCAELVADIDDARDAA